MSKFTDACIDAKVSAPDCKEAYKVEKLANHDEFFRPSYPVERHELLKALIDEVNSLSPAQLKNIAKVHERFVSASGSPPPNGGVDFDDQGNISGLTFGNAWTHFDVSYQPKDK